MGNRIACFRLLGKTQTGYVRQRKHDDEQQYENKRFFFHGCKDSKKSEE